MYRFQLQESKRKLTTKEKLKASSTVKSGLAGMVGTPMMVGAVNSKERMSQKGIDNVLKRTGKDKYFKKGKNPKIDRDDMRFGMTGFAADAKKNTILSNKKDLPKNVGFHELGHHVDFKKRKIGPVKAEKKILKAQGLDSDSLERLKGANNRMEKRLKKTHPLKRPFARHKVHSRLAKSQTKDSTGFEKGANKHARDFARETGGKKAERKFRLNTELPNRASHGFQNAKERRKFRGVLGDFSKGASGRTAISLSPTKTALVAGGALTAGIIAARKRKKKKK